MHGDCCRFYCGCWTLPSHEKGACKIQEFVTWSEGGTTDHRGVKWLFWCESRDGPRIYAGFWVQFFSKSSRSFCFFVFFQLQIEGWPRHHKFWAWKMHTQTELPSRRMGVLLCNNASPTVAVWGRETKALFWLKVLMLLTQSLPTGCQFVILQRLSVRTPCCWNHLKAARFYLLTFLPSFVRMIGCGEMSLGLATSSLVNISTHVKPVPFQNHSPQNHWQFVPKQWNETLPRLRQAAKNPPRRLCVV